MLRRLRALLRRSQAATTAVLSFGPLELDSANRRASIVGTEGAAATAIELGPREWTVLEYLLIQAMQSSQNGIGIEPGLADTVLRETRAAAETQEQMGLPAVMLVPAQLRDLLARFLKRAVPNIRVISHDEVPDFKTIRVTAMVGGRA